MHERGRQLWIYQPARFTSPFMRIALALLAMLAAASADELRVLTFNIRYDRPDPGMQSWTERRDAAAKIIREQADIAGLQEVLPQQRRDLAERCAEFEFVGIGREPGDKGEASPVMVRRERFAVLESGTFWFSDTPETVGSKSWGNDIPRICTWAKLRDAKGGGVLWLFNVHLDHRSQPSREKSAALLLERMAARVGKEPVVVMGDFNAGPENAAIVAMTREPSELASIFKLAGIPAEGTFHDFSGKPGPAAIDFIFLDPKAWRVASAQIDRSTFQASDGKPAWPSDHFPLRAVIERKP